MWATRSKAPLPLLAVSVPALMAKSCVPVRSRPPPVRASVLPVPIESDWAAAGFSTLRVLVVRLPASTVSAVIRELTVSVPAVVARAV